jgi:hypothetical protein
MELNIEALLWYILATDCSFAFTVSWFLKDWYDSSVPSIAKHFPATKGWSIVYLVLTLWLGFALMRAGVLPW